MARDIQQHVIATLRDNIGLQTVTVNVTVDDILTDDANGRGAGDTDETVSQRTRGTLLPWRSRCATAIASRVSHDR